MTIKETISSLLGDAVVSLEIQDLPGSQVVYLTYRDSIPKCAVAAHILSRHAEAEIGELERIHSDEVVMRTYSSMFGDSEYDNYWEIPEIGERIDTYLSDKTLD